MEAPLGVLAAGFPSPHLSAARFPAALPLGRQHAAWGTGSGGGGRGMFSSVEHNSFGPGPVPRDKINSA